jgi:hypothetical protein
MIIMDEKMTAELITVLRYRIKDFDRLFIKCIDTTNNKFTIIHREDDKFFDEEIVIHYNIEYYFINNKCKYTGKTVNEIIEEYNLLAKYYKMKKDIYETFDKEWYDICEYNDYIMVMPKEVISYRSAIFYKSKCQDPGLYDVHVDFLAKYLMAGTKNHTYSRASELFMTTENTQIKAYLDRLRSHAFKAHTETHYFYVKNYDFEIKMLPLHPYIKTFSITANADGIYKIDVLNEEYLEERTPSLFFKYNEEKIQEMKIKIPDEMSTFASVYDLESKLKDIIKMSDQKIPSMNKIDEDTNVIVLNKEQLEKFKKNMDIWF